MVHHYEVAITIPICRPATKPKATLLRVGQSGFSAMSAIPITNAIPAPHHAVAITSKVLGGQVLPGELSFSTRSHQHVKSKEMNRGALRVCGSASPHTYAQLVVSAGLRSRGCWCS